MRFDKFGRELYPQKSSAEELSQLLSTHFEWFGGVPDSVFSKIIPKLPSWYTYPRENTAIATAFGAHIGGLKPVVFFQNSGLGLCLDALLGTFLLYNQGLLIVVSNRGVLQWEEPQHKRWGEITHQLLEVTGIQQVSFDLEGLDGLHRAIHEVSENKNIVALLVERGNIDE